MTAMSERLQRKYYANSTHPYRIYEQRVDSFLKPGDTLLGMDLSHGGHLTHGSPVNFSGKLFNIVFYHVRRETGTIDYDEVERLAKEHRPTVIVAGASAYPRIIDFPRFRAIA